MSRPTFLVVATCLLLAAACSAQQPSPPTGQQQPTGAVSGPTTTTTTTGPTGTTAPSQSTPRPPQKIPRAFDRKNFEATLSDINPWVPLTPGIQTVRKGFEYVGGRRLPAVRVTTITDLTKKVDGVHAILILDQDFNGGQLTEQAVDYLAEDIGGNVWYLGSYTEAYEGGQFLNAQDAWLAGVNGAVPGLYFPGKPKTGSASFYQTKIPGGEQTTAIVAKVGQRNCVPFKCYRDVVVIREGGSEDKFWAPGVGQIRTQPLSGAAQETEELVNIRELGAKALAELSAEALRLDRHAASTAPSVFGRSQPAKRIR